MKLHPVLEHGLSQTVEAALPAAEYTVTGRDITLEQFRDYASDGPPNADAALIDGTLGVADKNDTVRLLADIRMFAPDLRLIVMLPETADAAWVKGIGHLGIYDIHCTSQFSRELLLDWLQNKRSFADLRMDTPPVQGALQKAALRLSKSQPVKTVIQERFVGSVLIGVGGAGERTGCTHTALSLAAYTVRYGSVAYVECGKPCVRVLDTDTPSRLAGGGFHLEGVDIFEAVRLPALLSAGYDYVILDLGTLDALGETMEREYVRCHLRVVTAGAAVWDVPRLFSTLDAWTRRYPEQSWHAVLHFADSSRFEEIASSLTAKEKQQLKLTFHQAPIRADPLEDAEWPELLRDVLPKLSTGWKINLRYRVAQWFQGLIKREV